MKWICAQIGAREHYAIPRVLHQAAKLDRLYTDLWAGTGWQALGSFIGRPVLATRYHQDLANAKVESFDITTMIDSAFGGELKKNPYDWFLYAGKDFGRSVLNSVQRKKGVNWKERIFFGYDTGFLEPAEWVKARGGRTIVCQMDPSRVEINLVKEEEKLWPDWTKNSANVPEEYFRRREREWAIADLVMVNSEWTKTALVQQGVSEDKIVIVPLAYEISKRSQLRSQRTEFPTEKPFKVLFLGQVILRKGIQYLIEAAQLLRNEAIHFEIVGPISISDEAIKSSPSNMTFHGAISRNEAPEFFKKADLFVLPTLSDGFALTQIEAMAYGLPVIITPNCGTVVSNGEDGVIIPVRDSAQLATAILSLKNDPARLERMSQAALIKASEFNLSCLGEQLQRVEERVARSC